MNDIDNESSNKEESHGSKGKDMKTDAESMGRKGGKMKIKNDKKVKSEKLIGKKKPEKVPYKARKVNRSCEVEWENITNRKKTSEKRKTKFDE